jgi:hypothetical protein
MPTIELQPLQAFLLGDGIAARLAGVAVPVASGNQGRMASVWGAGLSVAGDPEDEAEDADDEDDLDDEGDEDLDDEDEDDEDFDDDEDGDTEDEEEEEDGGE